MLETMVAFNMAEHLGGLTFEGPDAPNAPAGYARLLAGGRKPAPTRDGYVALLPYSGDDWVNFFKEAGRDDLAREFDLKDKHERNAKVKELYAAMHDVTRQMTTDACMALCDRLDIPATRLWSIQDLPNHPHLKAVDFFEHVEHPTEGPIRSVRTPTLFGATPAQTPRPAPHIGQHTEELLREAGYDGKAIAEMSSRGIVACFAMP
jgi:formyl-CoA transferase